MKLFIYSNDPMDQAYQRRTVSYYYGTTRAFDIDIWQLNGKIIQPFETHCSQNLIKVPFYPLHSFDP